MRRLPPLVDAALLVAISAIVVWEPRAGGEGAWYFIGIGGSLSLLWVVVGSLVASRDRRNPIGWLVLAIGLVYGVWGLTSVLGAALVLRDVDSGIGVFLAWLGTVLIGILVVLPFLFLLFPTGRSLSPGWRLVGWLAAAGGVATMAGVFTPDPSLNSLADVGVSVPNPIALEALAGSGGAIAFLGVLTILAASVLAVISLVLRFRRSDGDERQQIRWLAFVGGTATTLLVLQILVGLGGSALGLGEDLPIFIVLFGLFVAVLAVGIPLATGVAILKYHLYDLDIVIKKTVQYGVLVVAFVVVIGLLVLAIPATLMGTGFNPDVLPVLALAVALALLFSWIRRPARRFADRIVYGTRATPYEVLSEFSERVGETYSADDVLPRMATVLGEGSGAEQATVWLRVGVGMRAEAVWPAGSEPSPALPDDAVEVVHQGETLGALSVQMPANDPMNPSKEKLIRDLAAQAGLVLRNVRLIEELRDSRRRLVAAQDEERRKLERNIHDGAQQQLVALQVKLRLAEQLAGRDATRAEELLRELQSDTGSAIEDLRDLARGIYPPLLADRGLAAALEAQARKSAVPTTVDADGIGRYPQEVEAAVYFSCLEALQNTAKYAAATHATVSLTQSDGHLTFRVADDGRGFDPAVVGSGTGLQGIADRLAAIGGDLTIESAPGAGSSLTGTIATETLP